MRSSVQAWLPALLAAAGSAACQPAAAPPPTTPTTPPPTLASCPAARPPSGARSDRFQWLAASFRKSLAALDAEPDPTTRDLMNGALAALVLDGDGKAAEAHMARVFATQNAEGAFPWNERVQIFKDQNALEFVMQSLGPILLRYKGCLREEFVASILPRAQKSLAALARDTARVKPVYTNIWLLNSVTLLLVGAALDDAEAEAKGLAGLEEWRARVKRDGVFEFESPTYTAVDLDTLALAERYARPPRAQKVARDALSVLWADVAANWFAPRESLVAPHSRDYDFLAGVGEIDVLTALAGWRRLPAPEPIDLWQVTLLALEAEADAGFQPPERLADMARSGTPRVVTSRWYANEGRDEGRERYAFVTPRFAMGSTSAGYPGAAQFKPLEVQLDSPRGTPSITVVSRDAAAPGDDDPYGVTKRQDGAGHPKPVHLAMHPVAVQERGAMLASIVSDAPQDPCEEIATSVIFPIGVAGETVMIDGALVEGVTPRAFPLAFGSVLTVRVGGSAAAVRVVSADGCGQPAQLRFQLDAPGLEHHAGRLVVRQYLRAGATEAWRPVGCHPRVTLVLVADAAASDADARALGERARAGVEEQVERNGDTLAWRGRVEIGGVVLEGRRRDEFKAEVPRHVVRDVVRMVGGKAMHFGVLEVNGEELSGGGR